MSNGCFQVHTHLIIDWANTHTHSFAPIYSTPKEDHDKAITVLKHNNVDSIAILQLKIYKFAQVTRFSFYSIAFCSFWMTYLSQQDLPPRLLPPTSRR